MRIGKYRVKIGFFPKDFLNKSRKAIHGGRCEANQQEGGEKRYLSLKTAKT